MLTISNHLFPSNNGHVLSQAPNNSARADGMPFCPVFRRALDPRMEEDRLSGLRRISLASLLRSTSAYSGSCTPVLHLCMLQKITCIYDIEHRV